MARQHGQGALSGAADVEGTDQAVDAGGGDDWGPVLVPVVGEGFGGGNRRGGGLLWALLGGRVERDGGGEVVRGGGRGAQVEDAEVRVRGDGGEHGGRVRGEGGGVGAGVGGDGDEGVGALGRPLWFCFTYQ